MSLRLVSPVPLKADNGDARAEFTLKAGESADIILESEANAAIAGEQLNDFVTESLRRTINYWKDWISRCTYKGRWMEVGQPLCAPVEITLFF
jgi:GH15 family glucan-1,4-alpha-glucosidase